MGLVKLVCGGALALALNVGGGGALGGPLTPPGGPVTSTNKTLSEVEPRIAINAVNTPGDADSVYRITQPGSYYLTGNLSGIAVKSGIVVTSSHVTIDLNGFAVAGAFLAKTGITAIGGPYTNITVRNGVVTGWSDEGIRMQPAVLSNCRFADLVLSANTGRGLAAGNGAVITNCSATGNGTGISCGAGNTITGCTASANTGAGITTGASTTMTACAAFSNGSDGITASTGSIVRGCAAFDNTGNGFFVGTGIQVVECAAISNQLDGIRAGAGCNIIGNDCNANGNSGDGAGIHTTGTRNRIEGNVCVSADRGIDVDSTLNFVVRNTCGGNTVNWTIAAGNVIGAILDRTAPGGVVISGNTAASTLGTTDANANFSN